MISEETRNRAIRGFVQFMLTMAAYRVFGPEYAIATVGFTAAYWSAP